MSSELWNDNSADVLILLNITFKSNAMGYRRNHAAVQLRGI
jgi:hypothetical protein